MHCSLKARRIVCVHHNQRTGWMTLWIWDLLQPWKNSRLTLG
jgi:hypothetical protein